MCFFLSSTGEQKTVQSKMQMNVQANQKVEFQVKEPKEPSTINMAGCALMKKDPADVAREDNKKTLLAKDNSHQLNTAHIVAEKKLKTTDEHKQVDVLLQQGGQVNKARFKPTDHISSVSAKLTEDAKVKEKQGVMTRAANGGDSALMRGHAAAGVNKQQSLRGSATEGKAKEGSRVDGKPVGTHLTVGHMSTPVIKLDPLGVKESHDEMEIR